MPGGVPHARDHVRGPQRQPERGAPRESVAAQLHAARRAQHAAANDVSRAHRQSRPAGERFVIAAREQPPLSHDIGVLRAGWGYASVGDKIANAVLSGVWTWRWWTAFAIT